MNTNEFLYQLIIIITFVYIYIVIYVTCNGGNWHESLLRPAPNHTVHCLKWQNSMQCSQKSYIDGLLMFYLQNRCLVSGAIRNFITYPLTYYL